VQRKRSGKAVASLILGLLSFLPLVGLPAVIYGHLARGSIRRSGGRLGGKAMATVGLVLGYLWLAVWIGLQILNPPISLQYGPMAGNQAAAVGSLGSINTAAITYAATYNHGFPSMLRDLGPAQAESPNSRPAPSEQAAGLIYPFLAAGTHLGYRFTYIAGSADSKGQIQTYTVRAEPINPGVTGKMYYFTDQSGVIREQEGKPADAHSKPTAGF